MSELLYSLSGLVKYSQDKREIIFLKDTVNDAFMGIKSFMMLKNSEVLPYGASKMLRLGWDSYAVFECVGGGFKLNQLKVYAENGFKDGITPGNVYFSQIATYAVDTCTFLFLRSGNKCLIGHFNVNALAKASDSVALEIPAGDSVTGLISIVEDTKEKTFLNKMKSLYRNIAVMNRGAVGLDGYQSHFEIGVCKSGADVKVFGDLTHRTPEGNKQPVDLFVL